MLWNLTRVVLHMRRSLYVLEESTYLSWFLSDQLNGLKLQCMYKTGLDWSVLGRRRLNLTLQLPLHVESVQVQIQILIVQLFTISI